MLLPPPRRRVPPALSTLEADDVVLEDGIYEFWRGDDVFLRVPSTDIKELSPAAES